MASSDLISVAEAAQLLGVSTARIRERISDGSIPAEKVGSQWVILRDDALRVQRHNRRSRPYSSRSVWATLMAAHYPDHREFTAPERSRARARLRHFVDEATSKLEFPGSPIDADAFAEWAATTLRHLLGARAPRATFRASPLDLDDLRRDARVHRAGLSAPEAGISAADVLEGYVAAGDIDALTADFLLSPAGPTRANVFLHRVSDDAPGQWPTIVGFGLALMADLAEHDGPRERRAAADLLVQWLGAVTAQPGSRETD
ncbi:helix-turn-helix domain-containing protein [Aeromicrobium camelliae]|uniref:helix-turn-helix domain-containing protein n=1 Tax=Aeromicrobium camelliae TaxID=1538144 RepID=UPI0014085A42|nr:helix-turn-helix domain-containing protein [Aeromicrobium camelliae]